MQHLAGPSEKSPRKKQGLPKAAGLPQSESLTTFFLKVLVFICSVVIGANFRMLFAQPDSRAPLPEVGESRESKEEREKVKRKTEIQYEKSEDEIALETHEKKARSGTRIAPPTSMEKEKRNASSVEQLFRALSEESGSDGEVSVPLDEDSLGLVDPQEAERRKLLQRRREFEIRRLDTEITGGRKSMGERHSSEVNELERELGVEGAGPSDQEAPSFTLVVKKIKKLFKNREYEDALIEVTGILRHYPESAKLLLMKGSLHQRMGQIDLALAAFEASYEIEPSLRLKYQIEFLRRKVAERTALSQKQEGVVIPLGVSELTYGSAGAGSAGASSSGGSSSGAGGAARPGLKSRNKPPGVAPKSVVTPAATKVDESSSINSQRGSK